MWDKLKHEWKTVAWGVATGLLELWDQVLSSSLDFGTIVPPDKQWIVHVAIPIGFFALRRWVAKEPE